MSTFLFYIILFYRQVSFYITSYHFLYYFREGIILILVQFSFKTLNDTTLALIKIVKQCLNSVGLESFLFDFLYLII